MCPDPEEQFARPTYPGLTDNGCSPNDGAPVSGKSEPVSMFQEWPSNCSVIVTDSKVKFKQQMHFKNDFILLKIN
jgi:hypothetical protein